MIGLCVFIVDEITVFYVFRKGMNSFIRNKKSEFENKWGGVTKPNETLFYIEDFNISV